MNIFLYALIPSLFFIILNHLILIKKDPSSDHFAHLTIINSIKKNNHRFFIKDPIYVTIQNYFYPQLFHWVLSFFNEKLYKENYRHIITAVKIIEIVSFNLFLFYLYDLIRFDKIIFLYANIILHLFPFSYVLWNAKNRGLSARGLGLVFGQIYLYLMTIYLITNSIAAFIGISLIVALTILLSQMGGQFVLFSLPLLALLFGRYELFLVILIVFGILYLFMPNVTRNYIVGQFNHKRNYALFVSDIYTLKHRPGIYRDFVFDFWKKLQEKPGHALKYMYQNPIVEIGYGFIFLWFVLFFGFTTGYEAEPLQILFQLSIMTLVMFVLMSFRWTRFLGEPQRYVEFSIPLVTVLFILSYQTITITIIALTVAAYIIVVHTILLNRKQKPALTTNESKAELNNYISTLKNNESIVVASNDNTILHMVSSHQIKICTVDYSRYYKDKEAYYRMYYNDNFTQLSPEILKEYHEQYGVSILILNRNIYQLEELMADFSVDEIEYHAEINSYEVYLLN